MWDDDPYEYAQAILEDALEEEAYYIERDREIEEEQRNAPPVIRDDWTCSRCGKETRLPAPMGGCFCA
jgi:hypothetical protein